MFTLHQTVDTVAPAQGSLKVIDVAYGSVVDVKHQSTGSFGSRCGLPGRTMACCLSIDRREESLGRGQNGGRSHDARKTVVLHRAVSGYRLAADPFKSQSRMKTHYDCTQGFAPVRVICADHRESSDVQVHPQLCLNYDGEGDWGNGQSAEPLQRFRSVAVTEVISNTLNHIMLDDRTCSRA